VSFADPQTGVLTSRTSCNVQLSYHRRQLQTILQNSWAKTVYQTYDRSYPT